MRKRTLYKEGTLLKKEKDKDKDVLGKFWETLKLRNLAKIWLKKSVSRIKLQILRPSHFRLLKEPEAINSSIAN